jgi:hypothetical protein
MTFNVFDHQVTVSPTGLIGWVWARAKSVMIAILIMGFVLVALPWHANFGLLPKFVLAAAVYAIYSTAPRGKWLKIGAVAIMALVLANMLMTFVIPDLGPALGRAFKRKQAAMATRVNNGQSPVSLPTMSFPALQAQGVASAPAKKTDMCSNPLIVTLKMKGTSTAVPFPVGGIDRTLLVGPGDRFVHRGDTTKIETIFRGRYDFWNGVRTVRENSDERRRPLAELEENMVGVIEYYGPVGEEVQIHVCK